MVAGESKGLEGPMSSCSTWQGTSITGHLWWHKSPDIFTEVSLLASCTPEDTWVAEKNGREACTDIWKNTVRLRGVDKNVLTSKSCLKTPGLHVAVKSCKTLVAVTKAFNCLSCCFKFCRKGDKVQKVNTIIRWKQWQLCAYTNIGQPPHYSQYQVIGWCRIDSNI